MRAGRDAGASASGVSARASRDVRAMVRNGPQAPGLGRSHANMSHPSNDPPTTAGVSHAGR